MQSPYSRRSGFQKNRVWAPKVWLGAELCGWFRLLRNNRSAVDWKYSHWLVFITFAASLHTALSYLQKLIWGRRIEETRLPVDPLFIIGHWRTGTTWLHELLCVDDRFTFPTTYECFDPNHFLLTERFGNRLLSILMPSRRPMDAMPMAFDRPQEDEFALCNLGQPSPYLTIAFPNHPQGREFLDFEGVLPEQTTRWKHCLLTFLKQITVSRPKRIVLKSPTHTFRIKVLLDLFPNAKFVHLMRDPYFLFPSTVHMWKSLYRAHGLESATCEGLEEQVFHDFIQMHERLDDARPLMNTTNFCEVRYEDLVKDPVLVLRTIYRQLGLGDFEQARPKVESYLWEHRGYQVTNHELPVGLREEITRRWRHVIDRYGYGRTAG